MPLALIVFFKNQYDDNKEYIADQKAYRIVQILYVNCKLKAEFTINKLLKVFVFYYFIVRYCYRINVQAKDRMVSKKKIFFIISLWKLLWYLIVSIPDICLLPYFYYEIILCNHDVHILCIYYEAMSNGSLNKSCQSSLRGLNWSHPRDQEFISKNQ